MECCSFLVTSAEEGNGIMEHHPYVIGKHFWDNPVFARLTLKPLTPPPFLFCFSKIAPAELMG